MEFCIHIRIKDNWQHNSEEYSLMVFYNVFRIIQFAKYMVFTMCSE